MIENCLFCKIIRREIPANIIYEDEEVLAFLDIFPVSKGHTLIIPKNHAQDLSAGSESDAVAIMRTAHFLAPKIIQSLGATGYNLGLNNGADAGQEVFHTHLHLMPRYANQDRSFQKTQATPEELVAIKEQIISNL